MEAMASGIPIMCSQTRGCTDLVDSEGGVLVDPFNVDEIIDALNKLADATPQQIEAYKVHNKNRIQKFSVQNVLKELHRIYCDI